MYPTFAQYLVSNLHHFVKNTKRVTTNEMVEFYKEYCTNHNIEYVPFDTTNKLNAFVKQAVYELCADTTIEVGDIVSNVTWTESGITCRGKAYNFDKLACACTDTETCSASVDLHAFENQRWLREDMKKYLQSIADVSENEYKKLVSSLE